MLSPTLNRGFILLQNETIALPLADSFWNIEFLKSGYMLGREKNLPKSIFKAINNSFNNEFLINLKDTFSF